MKNDERPFTGRSITKKNLVNNLDEILQEVSKTNNTYRLKDSEEDIILISFKEYLFLKEIYYDYLLDK
tara:strand:+ start:132 stop:335 length:204 start_codon:yes stop_codon:yes gene_type:complete